MTHTINGIQGIPLTPEILNKTDLYYNEELDRWQKGDETMLIVKRIDGTATYKQVFGIEPPEATRYRWVVYWQISVHAEPVIVVPIIQYLHQLQSVHYVLWNWKELKVNL